MHVPNSRYTVLALESLDFVGLSKDLVHVFQTDTCEKVE